VIVPEAPNPILLAELRRPETRVGVQGDNVIALFWRITNLVPDCLRRFAAIGDVGEVIGEVEDRFAARHLGPAVWLRWISAGVTRFPLAGG
jgi:hypothetical protein